MRHRGGGWRREMEEAVRGGEGGREKERERGGGGGGEKEKERERERERERGLNYMYLAIHTICAVVSTS